MCQCIERRIKWKAHECTAFVSGSIFGMKVIYNLLKWIFVKVFCSQCKQHINKKSSFVCMTHCPPQTHCPDAISVSDAIPTEKNANSVPTVHIQSNTQKAKKLTKQLVVILFSCYIFILVRENTWQIPMNRMLSNIRTDTQWMNIAYKLCHS